MGKTSIILAVISIAFAIFAYQGAISKFGSLEVPANLLEPNPQWGRKVQGETEDIAIKPFKIAINDNVIKDLKLRLEQEIKSANRLPPPLEGTGFEYGFNSKYLQTVTNYWLQKYDWREREKNLNKYPHFTTRISGLNIHFQHIKSNSNSKYTKTLPLLLLHGWPGSFVEFQKVIPLLTEPKNTDFNFELIIPSLPGYGFSESAARPGLDILATAQIFLKLMQRLGHEKFYVQGGDWGSFVAADMAVVFPNNVIAMHSNMCNSAHPLANIRMMLGANFPSFFLTQDEADRFLPYTSYLEFVIRETGYLHIQATKPDTVGVGLTHSPSGLAAYILEKFSTWTNANGIEKEDGGLTNSFTMDQLLDNIMVYWVTNSITTSMRYYSENLSKRRYGLEMDRMPVKVPTGCVVAGNDGYMAQTASMVQDKYPNVISYNYLNDGGHFLAYEHPKLLAADVISFIQKVETLRKN